MKILVIEDKQIHQDSARETLAGHDVTIVGSFDEAKEVLSLSRSFDFDVVLTDMMIPVSARWVRRKDGFDPSTLVPYGFIFALRAAERGAKYIALLTDTNHHQGAMSNALDMIDRAGYYSEGLRMTARFNINGAKCVFVHAPYVKEAGEAEAPSMDGRKDWGRVLNDLMADQNNL